MLPTVLQFAQPVDVDRVIDIKDATTVAQTSALAVPQPGDIIIGVAVGEALLTSLRTYLFVDTTNRIDLALGSQIIDRLLRLPLRYFDRATA